MSELNDLVIRALEESAQNAKKYDKLNAWIARQLGVNTVVTKQVTDAGRLPNTVSEVAGIVRRRGKQDVILLLVPKGFDLATVRTAWKGEAGALGDTLLLASGPPWRVAEAISIVTELEPKVRASFADVNWTTQKVASTKVGAAPEARSSGTETEELPENPGAAVWIEMTSLDADQGTGWGFGEALFSPTTDARGADRYATMREPQAGDIVIHFADDKDDRDKQKQVVGWSRVVSPVDVFNGSPPVSTVRSDVSEYYRIALGGHTRFRVPVPVRLLLQTHASTVRADIEAGAENYPFAIQEGKPRTAQGQYLTRCTPALFAALREVTRGAHWIDCVYVPASAGENFAVGVQQGVWGFEADVEVPPMAVGDAIVLVREMSSEVTGFPRVDSAEKFVGTAREIVFGTVTRAPYQGNTPVWGGDKAYPRRIDFKVLERQDDAAFAIGAGVPRDVVEAVRLSAVGRGRAKRCVSFGWGPFRLAAEPILDLNQICSSFAEELQASHIRFGDEHTKLVRRFVCSLVAKQFVILTGLSGSGKTQLAIKFGEWLGRDRVLVLPVRPDWTGPEPLLGYEDALLKPSEDGRRAWTVPDALSFMLRAAADHANPYLLVLDEMNLAHVERYFADVLSGMESRSEVLPNLAREAVGAWYLKVGAAPKLPFPRNLFIVGTVNVDETTYMFSPKVLDRANTIEFRVSTSALPTDLTLVRAPRQCAPGAPGLVAGFLKLATDDNLHSHASEQLDRASAELRALHTLLVRHGAEFGHRTFFEGIRLIAMLDGAGEEALDAKLDIFVLQKILPRLHGARRKLEPILRSLASFCYDYSQTHKVPELDEATVTESRLSLSMGKILRMLRSVQANQFASFTD